jgi:hypothetical protein
MDQQELIDKALEVLTNVAEFKDGMKPATAQRLEAMAKVTAGVPWDKVSTLSIGWESFNNSNTGTDLEFFPTLNVVMKEQTT